MSTCVPARVDVPVTRERAGSSVYRPPPRGSAFDVEVSSIARRPALKAPWADVRRHLTRDAGHLAVENVNPVVYQLVGTGSVLVGVEVGHALAAAARARYVRSLTALSADDGEFESM
jgi:hypothetical protein